MIILICCESLLIGLNLQTKQVKNVKNNFHNASNFVPHFAFCNFFKKQILKLGYFENSII